MNIEIINNKTFYILGLARSGIATARFILEQGGHVIAWDDHKSTRDQASSQGIAILPYEKVDWEKCEAIIVSPGVPYVYPEPHPALRLARKHKCRITNDIALMGQIYPDHHMIGVTGTNGKSTTTALIGHLLKYFHFEVAVGGNIGTACLSLPALSNKGIYVLEVSSFQLELLTQSPFHVAVFLNLSADHLDRHGNMENYIEAKLKIFNKDDQKRVIGVDDQYCQNLYRKINLSLPSTASLIPISSTQSLDKGIFVRDDQMIVKNEENEIILLKNLSTLRELKGQHNHQNIAAALAAVCQIFEIYQRPCPTLEEFYQAISQFKALPHRQQLVADWKNMTFINDSKATNWDSSQNCLRAFENILWIAGGRPKNDSFEFQKKDLKHVIHAFLIGEGANSLAQRLQDLKPFDITKTMDVAVKSAIEFAQKNSDKHFHVVLSPACTSFDQFQDYQNRGEVFEKLVTEMIQ